MIFKTKMGVAFLKLLLSGYLISAAVVLSVTEKLRHEPDFAVQQTYLPNHVTPSHYNIKLISNHIYSDNFEGESSTRIFISDNTHIISFHTLDLCIYNTRTTLINEGTGMIHKPINSIYNSKTHIYSLNFREKLSGLYTLNMKFIGAKVYNTEGFFKISYTNGGRDTMWLNATHFQAIGARRIFPCWDEPRFKTTFNISVHHHRNYTALSNTLIRDIEDTNNNMVWTHFQTTPVMSTYLVAVAITSFPSYHIKAKVLERQKMWCRSYSTRYTQLAQIVSKTITAYLKTNWESLKDIPKIDYVVIPDFQNTSNWHFRDGMSKWGLIFYRETRIIYNEELDSAARKIEVTRSVAHEVAHHWFGNLVSPFWWSFLWINDGITKLLAVDAVSKTFPDSRLLDLFVVQIQHESLHLDTYSLMKPLAQQIKTADINTSFISIPHKPPVLLRMVQHILTDVVFRKGINNYLNEHQFSSVTAKNLWDALQNALIESDYEQKLNVEIRMDAWITHSHYPVLNVEQKNKTNIIITQEKEPLVKDRWIAISFTTQMELDFNNTLPRCWLGPNDSHVQLFGIHINSYDWIILNLQQTGYYRVNYDLKIWQRIIRYLNSDNYVNIHVLNRAQIIDDLFYFAMEKKSNFILFWKLKNYLSRETDYVAWYPVIKVFEYLSTFISFSEIKLKEKMYEFLPTLLKKIGYHENPEDDDLIKCLRQEITKWACVLGDSSCRKNAIVKLEWHLANPEKNKILPWWKDWTFCKGLVEADITVWMKVLEIYKTESDNKILEYLTCSEDPNIIRMYLEQISTDNIILKDNDHINVFLHLIAKHAKNIDVFEYILENFEKIKPRQVNPVAALTILLNHENTEKLQNKIFSEFKYLNKDLIIKTIGCKLFNRKKRLEMIRGIMSNNIKETVFDKTKRYNKDTFERIKEFFLFSSNELQRNQKTNNTVEVIDTFYTLYYTHMAELKKICYYVEIIAKIVIGFMILGTTAIMSTLFALVIRKKKRKQLPTNAEINNNNNPNITRNSENSENLENSENSKNSENAKNSENSENSKNSENSENSKNSENPENAENSENPENAENSENSENSKNSKNSENSENPENSENSEN